MKFKTKRFLSGLIALVMIATSSIQSVPAFAAEGGAEKLPSYETVKVTNIEILDSKKETFDEAMNDQNESIANEHEDTYKAVYYVEPQITLTIQLSLAFKVCLNKEIIIQFIIWKDHICRKKHNKKTDDTSA